MLNNLGLSLLLLLLISSNANAKQLEEKCFGERVAISATKQRVPWCVRVDQDDFTDQIKVRLTTTYTSMEPLQITFIAVNEESVVFGIPDRSVIIDELLVRVDEFPMLTANVVQGSFASIEGAVGKLLLEQLSKGSSMKWRIKANSGSWDAEMPVGKLTEAFTYMLEKKREHGLLSVNP